MKKPLHKDRSFWIVAITLVGAANLVQFNLGVPWLRERVAAMRPAPRATNAMPLAGGFAFNQPANLDYGKKTYSWQRPRFEPALLLETPPQVVLIASEYAPPSGGWGTSRSNITMGIRMSAAYVVQSAYDWKSPRRVILPDEMPSGQFDFIANLPNGSLEALQAEIKKQWGLIANREVRQTNVVFLKLDHTNAPGLQAATGPRAPVQSDPGTQTIRAQMGAFFVSYLENMLQRPVIDQTGLTGLFDIQMPVMRGRVTQIDTFEQTRKMLLERLGLDLIQTNAPVEMLVVKKENGGNL